MKKHSKPRNLRNSTSESQLYNVSQGKHDLNFDSDIGRMQDIPTTYSKINHSGQLSKSVIGIRKTGSRNELFQHQDHMESNLESQSKYALPVQHELDIRELRHAIQHDDYFRESRSMEDFSSYRSYERGNNYGRKERNHDVEKYEEGKYDSHKFDKQSGNGRMNRNNKPYFQNSFAIRDYTKFYSEVDASYSDIRNFNFGSENSISKLTHYDELGNNYNDSKKVMWKNNTSVNENSMEMHPYSSAEDIDEREICTRKMDRPQNLRACKQPSESDVVDSSSFNIREKMNNPHEYYDMKLEEKFAEMANKYQNGKSLTMRDARGFAKDLGIIQDIDNELNSSINVEISNDIEDDLSKPNTSRKCWSRRCWSEDKHSHVLRPVKNVDSTETKWSKLKKERISAKSTSKWEFQQHAERKITKTYENIFSKWTLWSGSLKVIEGRYGTGVASFFIFLRWLLFLNLFIFITVFIFIIIPQSLILFHLQNDTNSEMLSSLSLPKSSLSFTSEPSISSFEDKRMLITQIGRNNNPVGLSHNDLKHRRKFLHICIKNYTQHVKDSQKVNFGYIQDFIQGTGWLEMTLMFTGFYTSDRNDIFGTKLPYNMAVAFLLVTLAYFLFSLIIIIKYANAGIREMWLESEGFGNKYCNMIFTGWDFCIEDKRTAKLKQCSIMQELKSQITEERFKAMKSAWSTKKKIAVFIIRFISNLSVLGMLIGAFFLLKLTVQESLKGVAKSAESSSFDSFLLQYLPSVTITALNFILPLIFCQVIKFEKYSKEFEIKLTLIRMLFVRLASIGILVASFYNLISCNSDEYGDCFEGDGRHCKRPLCWESYVGQQMYKLVMMDFFIVITVTFLVETPRRVFVSKYQSKLANMIGHQEFDIPSQVLAMVYSQALCWLGTFYSPLLPAVCALNLLIFFYVKRFTLLKNCVPSCVPYRASRSNTFFMAALMLTFLAAVVILGYSIAEIPPSVGCGPFHYYESMISPINEAVSSWPSKYQSVINFLFSTAFAVPVFVLLCLAMYYYITLASANYKMTAVLKEQLLLNSKDKYFLLTNLSDVAHGRKLSQ